MNNLETKLEQITIYHQTDTTEDPSLSDHSLEYGSIHLETVPYIGNLPSIRVDTEGKAKFDAEYVYALLEEIPTMLEVAYRLGQQNPNVEISQIWK